MVVLTHEAANTIRNQAEALAMGLEAHVLSVADAVVWADKLKGDAAKDGTFSMIAAMGGCDEQEVANALRTIPGPYDRDVAEVLLMKRLLDLCKVDPPRGRAMLCRLATSYLVHDDLVRRSARDYMRWKDEALHRDNDGAVPQAADELIAACVRFVERSTSLLDPSDGEPVPPWLLPSR